MTNLYQSPIHSFILHLGDIPLQEIFTQKELLLQDFGKNELVYPMEETIGNELQKIENMVEVINLQLNFFFTHNYFIQRKILWEYTLINES